MNQFWIRTSHKIVACETHIYFKKMYRRYCAHKQNRKPVTEKNKEFSKKA